MRLSVTTPRGALVEAEVDEVTAPGELGEFGVLPGHVPLMSALKPGVLWYKSKDRSGVIALVLVDQALNAGDVDRAAADRDLSAAERELAAWTGELDGAHHALVIRRGWAQARLDAADRVAPH